MRRGIRERDAEIKRLTELGDVNARKVLGAQADVERLTGLYDDAADKIAHYRNVAIKRGAPPDEMITQFDRTVCGIMSGKLNEIYDGERAADCWDEVERLRTECRELAARKEGEQTCSICGRPCYECDATPVGYLCARCTPSDDAERLQKIEQAVRGLFDALDYVLPHWREKTLGIKDPLDKDEVNDAWDVLAAVLEDK